MKETEIIEGNRLIAEFMGAEPIGSPYTPRFAFGYHDSWDWLMPVVEKIEGMGWNINILRTETAIYDNKFKKRNDGICIVKNAGNKLNSVWIAVVEFIKHHNPLSAL